MTDLSARSRKPTLSNLVGVIGDTHIQSAVTSIYLRADEVPNDEDLATTFFDVGVLDRLNNTNAQIIFGRRGTGKSHLFRMLALKVNESDSQSAIYFDLRIMGSSSIVSNRDDGIAEKCLNIFRDILDRIHTHLYQLAIDSGGQALETLDQLHNAIHAATTSVQSRTIKDTKGFQASQSGSAGADVNSYGTIGLHMGTSRSSASSTSTETSYEEIIADSMVFAGITIHLEKVLAILGITNLFLILDEWSSLPHDLQPFLAEYLRRAILPCRHVTLKIAALNFRSRFHWSLADVHKSFGFELGGDISANINLDDYYVFDKSRDFVTEVFLKILYLHLLLQLPANYLEETYLIDDTAMLRKTLFESPAAFSLLIRAGEGVVRDFFGVLTRAIQIARVKETTSIGEAAVNQAAADWYEDDKSRHITGTALAFLNALTRSAVTKAKSRYFMVEETQADLDLLGLLVDLRVLHLMRRGYTDNVEPGVRYHVYAIDYGAFVNIEGTVVEPGTNDNELLSALPPEGRCHLFGEDSIVPRIVIDIEGLGVNKPRKGGGAS